jgi:hypothetical protein
MLRRTSALPSGRANPYFRGVIRKPTIKKLTEAVRAAERELDAARKRSDVDAAARRLIRARAELKQVQLFYPWAAAADPH